MKNITRMLAVGLLILGDLGLSQAQMAPTRGWPTHYYWTAGLFEEPEGGPTYCAIHAKDGADTMAFALLQSRSTTAAVLFSTSSISSPPTKSPAPSRGRPE
jgi:hypothetical protein